MGLPGGGFFATSKAREKAEDKANQFAREEQARAQAEQRRLEEKFGLTPGELDRQDRTFELEKKRQEELERRAGIPGEDLLKELGPTTRALLERVSGRLGKTSSQIFAEEGGAPASLLLEELSRPGPIGPFEDELNLVLQQVNQQANRRGVFGGLPEGGIRFEQLGRAGVDLAIKSSRERIAQRQALAGQLFNIAASARQEAGTVGESALGASGQSRAELQKFLNDIQGLDQASKGRAAQVATQAFGIAEPTVRQFGQVPIDIQGFNLGLAAQQQQQIIEGLADLGTNLIAPGSGGGQKTNVGSPKFSGGLQSFSTERDPTLELLSLTGGRR